MGRNLHYRTSAFALVMMTGACMAVIDYKPERYDIILDRAPFGAEPISGPSPAEEAAADLAAATAAAQELRLCFLFETENGEIRAGFENKKAKPGDPANPQNIILAVGESFRGMKLQEIDIERSQATLLRNGRRIRFELTKAPTAAKPAPPKEKAPQRRFGGGFRRSKPPQQPAKPPEPELTPEEQEARRAEIRRNLQDYQMEVIRQGMPPLPIPLTQEMDDQLVAEGILPPSE
jgi:hypothetical protein